MKADYATKMLTQQRRTVNVEGLIAEDYFQLDYFQPDYFQDGTITLSAFTETSTVPLNHNRSTVYIQN